jgi:hypothetical protein
MTPILQIENDASNRGISPWRVACGDLNGKVRGTAWASHHALSRVESALKGRAPVVGWDTPAPWPTSWQLQHVHFPADEMTPASVAKESKK